MDAQPEQAATAGKREERLPLSLLIAFGAPAIAGAAMAIPVAVHMPRFYSDVVLVPLGYLAIAIAAARAFDALTDPIMGWLSDRTRTRWGRRKPWIAVGGPLAAITFWLLFSPPESLTPMNAAVWFAVTFGSFFLFITMVQIPHAALGAEISLDYHERSRLFGFLGIFTALGLLLASILPGVLEAAFGLDERSTFTCMASLYGALLVSLGVILLWRVPERREFVERESNPLIPGVRRALRNRPFAILMVAGVVSAIPAAIPAILMPFFAIYVIQPDEPGRWVAIFLALYLGCGFLFIPFWMGVARRIGKLATLVVCAAIGTVGSVFYFFAGPGDLLYAACIYTFTGIASGASHFLVPAMMADVIDYDELLTGKRREAQFKAFWQMIPKFVAIPGASLPIAILAAVGYVPNAAQTEPVLFTIRFLYSAFPATFYLLAIAIVSRYPISAVAHARIRAAIAEHARGGSPVDPLTGRTLAPPGRRDIPEAVGWFLDSFSKRELRRVLRHGPRRAIRDVARAILLSVAACGAAVFGVVGSVSGLDADPGPFAVLAVVASGLGLTALLFHVARIGPARRMAARPVSEALIRAHLAGGASSSG